MAFPVDKACCIIPLLFDICKYHLGMNNTCAKRRSSETLSHPVNMMTCEFWELPLSATSSGLV
jgi:hypothetical protein